MRDLSRRSLLRTSAALTAAAAGCSSPLGGASPTDGRPELEVFVTNGTDDPIVVTVAAFRADDRLFEHTYRLDPGHGDESKTVVGLPTSLRVDVRGRDETRVTYSVPATCESPEIDVRVRPDEIRVDDGCVQS